MRAPYKVPPGFILLIGKHQLKGEFVMLDFENPEHREEIYKEKEKDYTFIVYASITCGVLGFIFGIIFRGLCH